MNRVGSNKSERDNPDPERQMSFFSLENISLELHIFVFPLEYPYRS